MMCWFTRPGAWVLRPSEYSKPNSFRIASLIKRMPTCLFSIGSLVTPAQLTAGIMRLRSLQKGVKTIGRNLRSKSDATGGFAAEESVPPVKPRNRQPVSWIGAICRRSHIGGVTLNPKCVRLVSLRTAGENIQLQKARLKQQPWWLPPVSP